jgi:hypothetical protein
MASDQRGSPVAGASEGLGVAGFQRARAGHEIRDGAEAREATVARIDEEDARAELVATLLEKVRSDQYPSNTMLDLIEELLTPEETPAYVVFLQDRVRSERYPSMPLIKRLTALI